MTFQILDLDCSHLVRIWAKSFPFLFASSYWWGLGFLVTLLYRHHEKYVTNQITLTHKVSSVQGLICFVFDQSHWSPVLWDIQNLLFDYKSWPWQWFNCKMWWTGCPNKINMILQLWVHICISKTEKTMYQININVAGCIVQQRPRHLTQNLLFFPQTPSLTT